jgi:hypothetical protein
MFTDFLISIPEDEHRPHTHVRSKKKTNIQYRYDFLFTCSCENHVIEMAKKEADKKYLYSSGECNHT